MSGTCLYGWCRNLSENRVGGCHDLDLICDGCDEAGKQSSKGWRELLTLVRKDDEGRDGGVERGWDGDGRRRWEEGFGGGEVPYPNRTLAHPYRGYHPREEMRFVRRY
jgi:hypothetical protein